MNQKQAALAAFFSRKAEIDRALVRLQALSDEHFNFQPDDIHWGSVVDIGRYAELLQEISDMAFNEGEYAQ